MTVAEYLRSLRTGLPIALRRGCPIDRSRIPDDWRLGDHRLSTRLLEPSTYQIRIYNQRCCAHTYIEISLDGQVWTVVAGEERRDTTKQLNRVGRWEDAVDVAIEATGYIDPALTYREALSQPEQRDGTDLERIDA